MNARTFCLLAAMAAVPLAQAGSIDGEAVLGGAVGGAAGAAVGSAVGGREGAMLGGAVGAAAGVAIATDDDDNKKPSRPSRTYTDEHEYRHDNGLHRGHYKKKKHRD